VTPSPPEEAIVELCPPAAFGFSGTVKYYRRTHADTIRILLALGYTIVNEKASST
jgi:hypothetical protein